MLAIKISNFILNTNPDEFTDIINYLHMARTDKDKQQVVDEITDNIKKSREMFNRYVQKHRRLDKVLEKVN